ncbi:formyltransferase family protein [Owenweeksia hongkongensis]|uniref:formyltransferase family protein n=1 Tax=Owenweeksia hongkongensis TaxID=253245 RepID=UPI003A916FBF
MSIEKVVLLGGEEQKAKRLKKCSFDFEWASSNFTFDPNISLAHVLKDMGADFEFAPNSDVNSQEFVEFLSTCPGREFIYSGKPGVLLDKAMLSYSGKRFLHAHGGRAPRYSGSTAFYYSILEEGTIGATVFWMNQGIDTGEIVAIVERAVRPGLDIDFIQDPLVRAEALVKAIECLEGNQEESVNFPSEKRVAYHVIHPVLKSCALRKVNYSSGNN